MKLKTSKPDIYTFHDYRVFLKDWFDYCKTNDSSFSLRKLAKKCHLSHGFFSMVLSEKIALTDKALISIEDHLGLNKQEFSFLSHLVHLSESKSLDEQRRAYQKISKFRMYKHKNLEGVASQVYLSNWYNVAIREMAHLPDFQLDEQWIHQRLGKGASLAEVRYAIKFLVKEGYIEVNKGGKSIPSDKTIHCKGNFFKLALTEFYNQMLNKAIDAIYTIPREDRDFKSETVALSPQSYDTAKKILSKAMQEIETLANNEEHAEDEVYHLSYYTIPLTKKKVS